MSAQLSLDYSARSRRTDPPTSAAAAARVNTNRLERLVLEILRVHGGVATTGDGGFVAVIELWGPDGEIVEFRDEESRFKDPEAAVEHYKSVLRPLVMEIVEQGRRNGLTQENLLPDGPVVEIVDTSEGWK